MYDTLGSDLWATMPILIVALAGLVIVVVDCFSDDSPALPVLAQAGLLVAGIWEALRVGQSGLAFFDLFAYGGFASFVNVIIVLSALLTIPLSVPYLRAVKHNYGEVHALILFATTGMMVLASSNSLVTLFVGLETMSICLYILTGLVRENVGATESALKYFLLGAFATGFFLYGMALLYGATGTMYLNAMAGAVQERGATPLVWAGIGLLLIGFLFKVSAVPFHMWTPDVYQGAPTTLTGYMATGSKGAAFAALVLVLSKAVPFGFERWSTALAVIALVTMVLGNLLALPQNNVKRMLAYSSIAHAGYILVGLSAGTADAYAGTLFYLLVYTLMNIGAFGVMAVLEWDGQQGREQTLQSLAGVGVRRPVLGILMAFFMFSLAGFPPLAGFFAKVRIFAPAIDAGLTWLVVVGVLASILSAFYYLRVLFYFWFKTPEEVEEARAVEGRAFPVGTATLVVLILCAAAQIGLFVWPAGLLELARSFFASGVVTAIP